MRVETFMLPLFRQIAARPRLSSAIFGRDRWGDPFAMEVAADPYPMIARMWEDGPVVHRRAFNRWIINGYDECQYLAAHPGASAGVQLDGLFDEVSPHRHLASETKDFFRNWMLVRDGEDHARLRRLVSRAFTPKRIAEWEPGVQAATDDLLDGLEGRESFEVVGAFNKPLPVNVICTLLGIPEERWIWVGEIVTAMSTFLDPVNNFDREAIDRAVAEFHPYVVELAAERLARPADDIITSLAQAEDDGDRLSQDELVANVGLLVFAGNDTTTHMLGNAMVALAQNPDQRALVREQPELWPNAVEELLRFKTVPFAVSRELTQDIEVGDVTIPAGAGLSLQLNAANRDPRRWDDPYVLRLDREDPKPISFGHGLHYCLGNALARMELRVALRAFVERFGDFTVDKDIAQWRRSIVLHGPTRLVVRPG